MQAKWIKLDLGICYIAADNVKKLPILKMLLAGLVRLSRANAHKNLFKPAYT